MFLCLHDVITILLLTLNKTRHVDERWARFFLRKDPREMRDRQVGPLLINQASSATVKDRIDDPSSSRSHKLETTPPRTRNEQDMERVWTMEAQAWSGERRPAGSGRGTSRDPTPTALTRGIYWSLPKR